jgi:hypothetical protein
MLKDAKIITFPNATAAVGSMLPEKSGWLHFQISCHAFTSGKRASGSTRQHARSRRTSAHRNIQNNAIIATWRRSGSWSSFEIETAAHRGP